MADVRRGSAPTPADEGELAQHWATVVRGVLAVQQSFAAGIEAVGISLSYYAVLTQLLDAEDHRLPMSRIARDLSMTTGGFTKLADRMGRDGLIDRRGSSGDRRVVFAALTEHGLDVAGRARQEYLRLLRAEVPGVISVAELRAMAGSAQRLVAAHRAADSGPVDFATSPPEPGSRERRRRSD